MSIKKLRFMICETCKKDLDQKDFILRNTSCYRCVYKEKSKLCPKKKKEKANNCKICGSEIPKNDKKRQRWIYCSSECFEKGHTITMNSHWTKVFLHN